MWIISVWTKLFSCPFSSAGFHLPKLPYSNEVVEVDQKKKKSRDSRESCIKASKHETPFFCISIIILAFSATLKANINNFLLLIFPFKKKINKIVNLD